MVGVHFGKDHPYYCIFNRKTIKLSYSGMTNMENQIKSHNAKVLEKSSPPDQTTLRKCNCRNKDECPLDGKCLTTNVIYEAKVKTSNEEKVYIGSTGRSFKDRYNGHKYTLRHKTAEHSTELSKYVWQKRAKGESPKITWRILHSLREPRKPQRICATCNLERIEIAAAKRNRALNKKSEMTGKCIHFARFYF